MNYRKLNRTSLSISTICLGTMTFGIPVARAEAIALVHAAIEQGINFFDTADIYEGYARVLGSAGGVGETILGEAIAGRRDKVILTTKVGNPVGADSQSRGLGAGHIGRQLAASLRRLNTDYVDLYEFHRPDPETPLVESLATLNTYIKAGKIRHWGFSNFPAEQIQAMVQLCAENGWDLPVVNQAPYSWLAREIETAELPLCESLGIAVTPYRPLQSGLLTGKYRPGTPAPAGSRAALNTTWLAPPDAELFKKLAQFEAEARQRKLPPAQYAIQWLLEKPAVVSVVVGVTSIAQLRALTGE